MAKTSHPQPPHIECAKCGVEHHIDATTLREQGRCSNCLGFLRRPTRDELEQFYGFMEWKAGKMSAAPQPDA